MTHVPFPESTLNMGLAIMWQNEYCTYSLDSTIWNEIHLDFALIEIHCFWYILWILQLWCT